MTAENTRQHIIDSALEIFAERGFENCSIKNIAQQAEVSTGLIYHYFKSKDQLFEIILDEKSAITQKLALLQEYQERIDLESFKEFTQKYFKLAGSCQQLHQLFFREFLVHSKLREQLQKRHQKWISSFAQYLDAFKQKGLFKIENPKAVASILSASIFLSTLSSDKNLPATIHRELLNLLQFPTKREAL